jgi:hypothetical protein
MERGEESLKLFSGEETGAEGREEERRGERVGSEWATE